jgi:hypothetical protein
VQRTRAPTAGMDKSSTRHRLVTCALRTESLSRRESSYFLQEREQIDAVERRLAQKQADFPHDQVAAVVQHAYAGV